jgi:hypothetical protein
MLARIKKAVVGGFTGGLAAGVAFLAKAALDGSVNADDVSQALGTFVAAGVVAGYAVYKARNTGSANGSYPR